MGQKGCKYSFRVLVVINIDCEAAPRVLLESYPGGDQRQVLLLAILLYGYLLSS